MSCLDSLNLDTIYTIRTLQAVTYLVNKHRKNDDTNTAE